MSFDLSRFTPEILSRLPAPRNFAGYITGVGSRDTPPEACLLLQVIAAVLFSYGYIWRSGGASGADEAIEQGVLGHPAYSPVRRLGQRPPMEIYLPWNGFQARPGSGAKKTNNPNAGYIDATQLDDYDWAKIHAAFVHPAPGVLQSKPAIMALHARNAFQVLGQDLHTPSQRLYCWAVPTDDGLCAGGTRTALALAQKHNVPVVNFHTTESVERTLVFLELRFLELVSGMTLGSLKKKAA